jgi:hypothetical protein
MPSASAMSASVCLISSLSSGGSKTLLAPSFTVLFLGLSSLFPYQV